MISSPMACTPTWAPSTSYYPGYTEYWRYLKEFSLTAVPYPRRDNMVRYLNGEKYEEADLHRPAVLSKLGFNQKENRLSE